MADYAPLGVVGFHHNIDPGREGMILDVDTNYQIECVNLEVDKDGNLLHMWNFADIIIAAMVAGGDHPHAFVAKAPNDWFHNNATTYRVSDNTLISSSRENFVIAVNYKMVKRLNGSWVTRLSNGMSSPRCGNMR